MLESYPPPINCPVHPNGSSLNQDRYAVGTLQENIGPMVEELQLCRRHPVVVEDNTRVHDGQVPACT